MNERTTKPADQRPEHPDFWCKRFGEGVTPWDAGRVQEDFAASSPAAAAEHADSRLRQRLGSRHLADHRWPVTALDFSPTPSPAPARFSAMPVDLVCADFFTWQPAQRST